MLELNYETNKLLRLIIQTYLHNFNHVAIRNDKALTNKMYDGSKELKQIYDKIPSLNLYLKSNKPNNKLVNMKIDSEEAYLLLSTMDCARGAHAVKFGDKYSKELWSHLEIKLDKIWLKLNDLSDLDLVKQRYKQVLSRTANQQSSHSDNN